MKYLMVLFNEVFGGIICEVPSGTFCEVTGGTIGMSTC